MTTYIEKQLFAEDTFSLSTRFEGDFNFSIRGIFLSEASSMLVLLSPYSAVWITLIG
jgi:hypothetical protein